MSADFPLITDLPLADQQEIARIQAIDEAKRTASESAYLDSRQEYLDNEVLTVRMRKGNRNPNAIPAQAILTFTGDVSDGETVTIGVDVYEFDDDDDVEAGHIQVDISGGTSGEEALDALATAKTSNGTENVNHEGAGNDFRVFAPSGGFSSNGLVDVSTTCANASWDSDTLVGGQNAVLGNQGEFFYDFNQTRLYFTSSDSVEPTDTTWEDLVTFG